MKTVELEARIRAFLSQDDKPAAVKLVMQTLGGGLRQSKNYVDNLEAQTRETKAPADYAAFSAEQLLEAIEYAGRFPHPDLIRVCLERPADLSPHFLKWLEVRADMTWEDDSPCWYRDIHAGILLCGYREAAALPLFAEIIREDDHNFTEWFHYPLVSSYGPVAIPMLLEILRDQRLEQSVHITAYSMLNYIGLNFPETRVQIIEIMTERLPISKKSGRLVFTRQQKAKPSELWTWAVMALMDLRDTATQSVVVQMFKQGLINERIFGDVDDYLAAFDPDAALPLDARRDYTIIGEYESRYKRELLHETTRDWEKTLEEVLTSMGIDPTDIDSANSGATKPPSPPTEVAPVPVTVSKKVRRNDPCPCGSGKKYKQCCLKKGR